MSRLNQRKRPEKETNMMDFILFFARLFLTAEPTAICAKDR